MAVEGTSRTEKRGRARDKARGVVGNRTAIRNCTLSLIAALEPNRAVEFGTILKVYLCVRLLPSSLRISFFCVEFNR